VPLTAIEMIKFIIVVVANTVLNEIVKLKLQNPGGKLPDIRKKPHAIDVVFVVSLQRNC
jgi:hypothetical protein